ncbi:hypothetical protein A8B78_20325 [Jannaschia sp. EhC01]|nr:hypothetical protein A8B78_20325 [Jannaschia sp. EhC01]
MTSTLLDPSLIGIWLLPGQPQTYEITEDGSYYIAEPDEALSFTDGGAQMIWGGRTYTRVIGEGMTPVGTWREDDTGDGWDFTADHAYTILSATDETGETFTGIWALRNDGTSLWTCEKQADIETDGAHLTFITPSGERLSYGYTVDEGLLSLLDPDTWQELTRYISAERMVRSAAG